MQIKNVVRMLGEGAREKAAEKFLSDMINRSPFKGKVFIAGGYVRDELMGIDPKDIDLVIELPDGGIKFAEWATKKMGNYKKGSNPVVYKRFGTAKFNLAGTYKGFDLGDIEIESVMSRSEQYSKGSRKPKVQSGTLKQDVERRDFTVNSLLKNLSTGEIVDLTGQGRADLKKGVIKTPLDPDVIFTEDPLRMLRAVRFTAKYGWQLPLFMIKAMKKNAAKINNISDERVREELDKMITTKSPKQAIKILKVTGLLKYVMPELQATVGVWQNKHHDKDVFNHILDVVQGVPPELPRRLAALFHDIGKPTVKKVIDNEARFFGHEDIGSEIAGEIMKRLKYPNAVIDRIKILVANHMRLKQTGRKGEKATSKQLRKLKRVMGDHLEDLLHLMDSDNRAHGPSSSMPDQIKGIRGRLDKLSQDTPKDLSSLPISGNDIKNSFKLKPGPIYKDLLNAVQDAIDENPKLTKRQALIIVRDKLRETK